jgi:Protein of unknown function (DUF2889)
VIQLPEPRPRDEVHTRRIEFRCFFRGDGKWDVEAELIDTKPYAHTVYRQHLEAGEPKHRMKVRLTIDDDMIVQDIAAMMESIPFEECRAAVPPMHAIVGLEMGAGWRKAVDGAIGGIGGCTHMRELLYNAATAAYQAIPSHQAHLRSIEQVVSQDVTLRPPHLDQCKSWAIDGPVVRREMPHFYVPERLQDKSAASTPTVRSDGNLIEGGLDPKGR